MDGACATSATAAIDISDGLAADVGHICERSKLAATLELAALPRAPALAACADGAFAIACMLPGGDDYELAFTAPPDARDAVIAAGAAAGVAVTRIGTMSAGSGVTVRDAAGAPVQLAADRLRSLQMNAILRPTAPFMLSHPAHFIALGFGTGLSPFAPGTVGTAARLSAVLGARDRGSRRMQMLGLIAVLFCVGVWAAGRTGRALGIEDHSSMNIDEIVAIMLVLWLTPAGWMWQALAFFAFRFFDVVKPPPIRYFDRTVKGGFGVMFDDLLAAFYTLLAIAVCRAAGGLTHGRYAGRARHAGRRRAEVARLDARHRRVLHRRLGGAGDDRHRRQFGVVRARLRHVFQRRQARDARRARRTRSPRTAR